jgi:hypothetical protein
MRRILIFVLAVVSAVAAPNRAWAADDLTPLTGPTLPMPSPIPIAPGQMSFYLPNRLAVWQNYGVDRNGRWRPRVIMTGEGAFYYYNGMPYPLLPVQQLNVMPYLLD